MAFAFETSPDPVDIHVGAQVRTRRRLLGQSQEALAGAVGVSFQQIQKYERGANRISASMLVHIAEAQRVAPAVYFDGLGGEGAAIVAAAGRANWLALPAADALVRAAEKLPASALAALVRVAEAMVDAHAG